MLKNFIDLDPIEAQMVRMWRNHPRVRTQMFTSHEISFTEHQNFLASLEEAAVYYYLVYEDDVPIGVISLDPKDTAVEIGMYSNPELYGKGEILLAHIARHAPLLWRCSTLRAYVLPTNARAIACYGRFGFVVVKSTQKSLLMEYTL